MRSARRGFTLIELLAVMVILAILIGIGIKGYSLSRREAREGRARAGIEELRTALNEYRVEYGAWPPQEAAGEITSLEQIEILLQLAPNLELIDPWGAPFRHQSTGRYTGRVWSVGPDGMDGTDDDIVPGTRGY